ncbi:MAG TPA: hypothetical protein VF762_02015 [Blastocatellia bacterium]|jgi:hypothetical protein
MMKLRLTNALCLGIVAVIFLSSTGAGGIRRRPRDSQSAARAMRSGPLTEMDKIAELYVKLVLAVGRHDENYVDAYYGPDAWQAEAKAEKRPLDSIKQEAASLIEQLSKLDTSRAEEIVRLRHQYLSKQLESLLAGVAMLQGAKLTFDQESKSLYDTVAPSYPESHFQKVLSRLAPLLPGAGSLAERLDRFKRDFIIPKDKVDAVFKAAIEEARRRTRRYIALPGQESFQLEYVTGKSWSGYNWYKGNGHSLIQINTDLPIYIDRAIDLACHEGYPGHHVYNVMLESKLVKGKGWVEFSAYPLFSPQSLIAEGSANFGIEVAFPGQERVAYEREVLFPLAGLDPSGAERYYEVQGILAELSYAGNEAARRYLNGDIDRDRAAEWLVKYTLVSLERAQQRVRFFDQYRSYVINYNLGQDLVRKYIESKGGTVRHPGRRWDEFRKLISSPRLPSGLK